MQEAKEALIFFGITKLELLWVEHGEFPDLDAIPIGDIPIGTNSNAEF